MKIKSLLAVFMVGITVVLKSQAPAWQWAKTDGISMGRSNATCMDGSGNVYITGSFQGPSFTLGTITLTCNVNALAFFIAKYDPSGNILWARGAGGKDYDYGTAIASDASGNVFVTGYFRSPTMVFGTTTLTNAGNWTDDFFIVKYDASGNTLWSKRAGGLNNEYGWGISVDNNGNAFVTGQFDSPGVSFGSTTLTLINPNNLNNANNMFVAKYDAQGNALWCRNAESTRGVSVSADASGNAFVAGVQQYTTTFGSTVLSDKDVYIAKYDASGNVLWAKNIESQLYYLPVSNSSYFNVDICAEVGGGVFITGTFRDSTMIGSTMLTSAGKHDGFLAKYDGAGNVLWATRFGGSLTDYGQSVSTDMGGSVFVTGGFASLSLAMGNTTLANEGSVYVYTPPAGPSVNTYTSDVFVSKYDPWGNAVWAKTAGSGSIDDVTGIYSNPGGELVITGNFFDSSMVFFGSPSLTIAPLNPSYSHIFIAKLQDNATGIAGHTIETEVTVFPNPFSEQVTLRTETHLQNASLTLNNSLGQMIKQINNISGTEVVLLRERLPAGVYFLRLVQEGIIIAAKKIIVKD
jgi:hypothetical protein